jgi:glycosyltransferase involved in cell wall biosynthesis
MLRFLFLEPFFGGSHRDFAEGLATHSRHRIDLLSLPDRFWKWRMRGAALFFAQRIDFSTPYDGVIASSLLNLSDLKALWPGICPPMLLYFHENQLSYPLSPGEVMDYQYGFTNIACASAADRILFNSHTHRRAFLEAIPGFIRMMPDCRPRGLAESIAAKSEVAYPGCHFGTDAPNPGRRSRPPLIVWNHRWEHDKNPESFFAALEAVQRRDIFFRVALLGENFSGVPEIFEKARRWLGENIVRFGYLPEREEYYRLLGQGEIVVSTAIQENFGIAAVEAMRFGCRPLFPRRLSYPEILPPAFHEASLYTDQKDLEEKLGAMLCAETWPGECRAALSEAMGRFAWTTAVNRLDDQLEALARCRSGSSGLLDR